MTRVLIVGDSLSQVRALVGELQAEGFEAAGEIDAYDVVESLLNDPADLALIDLMMPGLNGIELARQIRDACPTVRVLLTSAYHLSQSQLLRADCGAVGFVAKPYSVPELARFLRDQNSTRPTIPVPARRSGTRLVANGARTVGAHREQMPLYP